MPKISVIIPVYNTSQYLERCLSSVVNQTLKDIEIICVDDCSSDNSLKILEEYAKDDNRIKVIDLHENYGPGYARNRGIEAAEGEYIGFVDSDDWVDLNFYEKLYEKAIETNADVVKAELKYHFLKDGTIRISDRNDKIRKYPYCFMCEFTTSIFKTEFLKSNALFFLDDAKICEDIFYMSAVTLKSKSICLVDGVYYNYLKHEDSRSGCFTYAQMVSYAKTVSWFLDQLNAANISEEDYLFIFYKVIFGTYMGQIKRAKISAEACEQGFKILQEILCSKVLYKEKIKPKYSIEKQQELCSQRMHLFDLRSKICKK